MAGYTKEDFDGAYGFGAEDEWGCPNTRAEVRLHYLRKYAEPGVRRMWTVALNEISLTTKDVVVLIGCGFGWGCEVLAEFSGASVIGVDTSPFVADEKNNDEDAEIEAACLAVGLELTDPRVQQIKDKWGTSGARSKTTILNEDVETDRGRANIIAAAPGAITSIITEDCISDMTDAELTGFAAGIDLLAPAATKYHVTSTKQGRSLIDSKTLTGHTIVYIGGGTSEKQEGAGNGVTDNSINKRR